MEDTGGAGRHRGGLSLTREYRILAEEAILSVRSDKRAFPPHGLFGGAAGRPTSNTLVGANGTRDLPVLMTEVEPVFRGDIYRHVMAGGGGYGDPLERDPTLVIEDVRDEKVSAEQASELYGVVIRGAGRKAVLDTAATEQLRRQKRCGRSAESEA